MGMTGASAATGRTGQRRRRRAKMADINVTPLVDVMLVLLIVFMVTAPLLTVAVPVDLPKTQAASVSQQEQPLVVTVDKDGNLFLMEEPMNERQLLARLAAISQGNPDLRLYVRGDKTIPYGQVMQVMGVIHRAGYTRVALMAELPRRTDQP